MLILLFNMWRLFISLNDEKNGFFYTLFLSIYFLLLFRCWLYTALPTIYLHGLRWI